MNKMNSEQLFETLSNIINHVIENKGESRCNIELTTTILGGELPVDSLDLAAIVVKMEDETGCDPFKDGFINFHTVGELVDLYVTENG